ncbi:MAG: VOC family protein [Streptosporangiaceae bacterium]
MIGKLQCVVLDCPDVGELAQFYQALLGGAVNQADPRWAIGDDFATLHTGSGLVFAFQWVRDYQAPRWPDSSHPQQFHLDLEVQDLDLPQFPGPGFAVAGRVGSAHHRQSRQPGRRGGSRCEPTTQVPSPRRTVDDTAASSGLAGRSSVVIPRAWFMAAS